MNPTLRASRAERSLALFAFLFFALAIWATVTAIAAQEPAGLDIWAPLLAGVVNATGVSVLRGIRQMRIES